MSDVILNRVAVALYRLHMRAGHSKPFAECRAEARSALAAFESERA